MSMTIAARCTDLWAVLFPGTDVDPVLYRTRAEAMKHAAYFKEGYAIVQRHRLVPVRDDGAAVTKPPANWPFPTYRGQPIKPRRQPKPAPTYPDAPPAPY